MKRNPLWPAGAVHPSPTAGAAVAVAAADEFHSSWRAAFCVLAVLLLVLLWFPITRIPAQYPRIQFPGPFIRLLFARYKLAFRTKWYAVFVPVE
jgi:hypothetical protein